MTDDAESKGADIGSEDEPVTSDVVDDDPAGTGSAAPKRAANSAAAAASRARRIGGRPVIKPDAAEPEADPPPEPKLSRRERKNSRRRDEHAQEPAKVSAAEDAAVKTSTAKPPAVKQSAGRLSLGKSADSTSSLPAPPKPRSDSSRDADHTGSRLAWLPAAVLIAAVVAMAIFFAVARLGGGGGGSSSNATREQVLAAAKSCAVASNSYSYKNLDAFEKKGLACGTGKYATEFKSSVEKVLRKNAAAVKQVQTFQVNDAGIISVSAKNQWDIMIYGQVNVSNVSTGKTGRVDPYGAIATMTRVHGTWRLSDLSTICSSTLLQSGNKCA